MSDQRVRMFVALDLPARVRIDLASWARGAVGGEPGMRVLAEDSLHVTLAFLGWRELGEAPRIGDAAIAQARPVPELRTAAAAWLPPRRPGVLVVDLDDGDGVLGRMHADVVDALVHAAGFEPEARPFRPHVTVARLRRGTRPPRQELPAPPTLSFPGEALTLYRSHLSRDGARYEPLARAGL